STAPYTNTPPQIWPNQIKVNQDKIIFSAETLTGGVPTNFWINPFTDSIMLNGFDGCIAQFGARGCGNAVFNPIVSTNPNGISQYVFHDICAGANYTFPNGSQVSNLASDTLQQSIFLNASNVDSIIYTQLNVSPQYQQSIYDTICPGANYYFVDGTMQTNIMSNQIHVSPYFSQYGCDSVITTYLSVNMVDTSVVQLGNSLICNNPGASYQWIQCNPISLINGATNQTYTPTSNGTYAVIIAESNCKDTSDCHMFVVTGNENVLLKNQISVYPNPTADWIHIEVGQLTDAASYTLYDAQGHVLMEQPLRQGKDALNLTSLASGFYYIKIGANVVKVT
ncbi:MAG TPA: T9SS type A sorting domain-containing protein, partial [Chitinophagaceae bacterium]|nr:T9SS type A sorting domain-containing protein [Chitinophagaceae bacterium]